jgi:hypothetical protein
MKKIYFLLLFSSLANATNDLPNLLKCSANTRLGDALEPSFDVNSLSPNSSLRWVVGKYVSYFIAPNGLSYSCRLKSDERYFFGRDYNREYLQHLSSCASNPSSESTFWGVSLATLSQSNDSPAAIRCSHIGKIRPIPGEWNQATCLNLYDDNLKQAFISKIKESLDASFNLLDRQIDSLKSLERDQSSSSTSVEARRRRINAQNSVDSSFRRIRIMLSSCEHLQGLDISNYASRFQDVYTSQHPTQNRNATTPSAGVSQQ